MRGVNFPSINGDQQNSWLSLHFSFPLLYLSFLFLTPCQLLSVPFELLLVLSPVLSLVVHIFLFLFLFPLLLLCSLIWDLVILGKLRQQCDECTHGASPGVQHGNALVDCCHSSSVGIETGGIHI